MSTMPHSSCLRTIARMPADHKDRGNDPQHGRHPRNPQAPSAPLRAPARTSQRSAQYPGSQFAIPEDVAMRQRKSDGAHKLLCRSAQRPCGLEGRAGGSTDFPAALRLLLQVAARPMCEVFVSDSTRGALRIGVTQRPCASVSRVGGRRGEIARRGAGVRPTALVVTPVQR